MKINIFPILMQLAGIALIFNLWMSTKQKIALYYSATIALGLVLYLAHKSLAFDDSISFEVRIAVSVLALLVNTLCILFLPWFLYKLR